MTWPASVASTPRTDSPRSTAAIRCNARPSGIRPTARARATTRTPGGAAALIARQRLARPAQPARGHRQTCFDRRSASGSSHADEQRGLAARLQPTHPAVARGLGGADAHAARKLQQQPVPQPQPPQHVAAEQGHAGAAERSLEGGPRTQRSRCVDAGGRQHLPNAARHLRPDLRLPRSRRIERDLRPACAQQLVGLDRDGHLATVRRDARQIHFAPDALLGDRVANFDLGAGGCVRGQVDRQRCQRIRSGRIRDTQASIPWPASVRLKSSSTRSRAPLLQAAARSSIRIQGSVAGHPAADARLPPRSRRGPASLRRSDAICARAKKELY